MAISKKNDLENIISSEWQSLMSKELSKPYFINMLAYLKGVHKKERIYPQYEHTFRAFNLCKPADIKVVIIGQDPYHGKQQANGLAFDVNPGVRTPPSLRNIYKELENDLGLKPGEHASPVSWAKQGVFMLNCVLTVKADSPGSHKKIGWQQFTEAVIKEISKLHKSLVFILWGAYAQKKESVINTDKHLILKSPHPSPLSASRGFFGNSHFSATNDFLKKNGQKIIIW